MRAAFFLLVFANLAFLAWAEWIDVPQPAPSNDVYAKLPRLKLVGEQPGAPAGAAAEDKRPPATTAPGSTRKTLLQSASPAAASRCFSVGPFDDTAGATRGTALLRDKGLTPRQRSAQGEVSKGFWVYIGGLKTDRDVTQVLHTLDQSHVEDAHLMPDTSSATDGHRVSVGLFSDRDRATRRAQSLHKLGLEPEVTERKLPATLFWVDVDVPPGAAAPDPQDFVSADAPASPHLDVTPCPPSVPHDNAAPLPTAPTTTPPFRTKVAGASKVP